MLPADKMEEFKQIDARIVFYLGQANRLTTAYFLGFVAFCAWVAKDANQASVIPFAFLLAVGLFLGVALLIIHGRAISRLRAYKIVFHERESKELWYESTRLVRSNSRISPRTRYYGFLGVILHTIAITFLLFDPLDCFAQCSLRTTIVVVAMLLPGISYSASIVFGKNDLEKYVSRYERYKNIMQNDESEQIAEPDYREARGR